MAPTFRSEAEERAFWEAHDSTDYVDWTHAPSVRLPNL
ncbi:MAG: CopG family antitoxin, partial [Steroidobacteraceae bacterium]